MLYVDGMNGLISHNETIQWLYTLVGSKVKKKKKNVKMTPHCRYPIRSTQRHHLATDEKDKILYCCPAVSVVTSALYWPDCIMCSKCAADEGAALALFSHSFDVLTNYFPAFPCKY